MLKKCIPKRPALNKHISKASTYAACKGSEHSYLHQVTDTSRSLCLGQAEEEIHSDHLSATEKPINIEVQN